jgi:DNA gyrase subunit B
MVNNPLNSSWIFSHHLADIWNIENGIYEKSKGRVRHHLDFNKINNNPDNIIRMGWQDHRSLHGKHASELHKNPIYADKIAKGRQLFWSNPENKKKNSENLSKRNRKNWMNPAYREKMRLFLSDINKKHNEDHPELKQIYTDRASRTLKKLWQDPAYREKISKARKDKWKDEAYIEFQREQMKIISKKIWLYLFNI